MLSSNTAKISQIPLVGKRPYYVDEHGMLYHKRSDGKIIQRVPTNSGRSLLVNYQLVNLSKDLQQLFAQRFGEDTRTLSNVQLAQEFFRPLECEIVSYITAERKSDQPSNWLDNLPEDTELYVHKLGVIFPNKSKLIEYVNKNKPKDHLQVFILAGTIKCSVIDTVNIEVV